MSGIERAVELVRELRDAMPAGWADDQATESKRQRLRDEAAAFLRDAREVEKLPGDGQRPDRNLIAPETAERHRTEGEGGYTFNAYPPDDYAGLVLTFACVRLGDHAHLDVDSGRQVEGSDHQPVNHRGKAGHLILRWPEWLMLRDLLASVPWTRIAEVERPSDGNLRIHAPDVVRGTEREPAPCPCGEPNPPGYPPCTFEKPCLYAQGMPRERWEHEQTRFEQDLAIAVERVEGLEESIGVIHRERDESNAEARRTRRTIDRLAAEKVAAERHTEVLAKALDQFFTDARGTPSSSDLARLHIVVEPTLQALGYPKEAGS